MVTAIVEITTEPNRINECAEEIAAIPGISEVYSVTGDKDLIAIVHVPELEDVSVAIADRLSKVAGVRETTTHLAFRTFSQTDLDTAFDLGND